MWVICTVRTPYTKLYKGSRQVWSWNGLREAWWYESGRSNRISSISRCGWRIDFSLKSKCVRPPRSESDGPFIRTQIPLSLYLPPITPKNPNLPHWDFKHCVQPFSLFLLRGVSSWTKKNNGDGCIKEGSVGSGVSISDFCSVFNDVSCGRLEAMFQDPISVPYRDGIRRRHICYDFVKEGRMLPTWVATVLLSRRPRN